MALTNSALLTLYKEALEAIATGQSYTIGGRSLSRANIREVRETIEWLERRIRRATSRTGDCDVVKFGNPQ